MKVGTTEHHLLKYLVKWQQNKNSAEWLANPHVQRVLTDGEVDIEKLRSFFIERGLAANANDFDAALSGLRTQNLLTGNGTDTRPNGEARIQAIKAEQERKIQSLEASGYDLAARHKIPTELLDDLASTEV